jgi:hypothetical protein
MKNELDLIMIEQSRQSSSDLKLMDQAMEMVSAFVT